ncbi:MAG: methionyl-tRNA formyltransferase, partial [Deltaproteobacteria bacterium]|nr:methionyl-tRNA formyltransferase [Deltaproteobacteria bacterium]
MIIFWKAGMKRVVFMGSPALAIPSLKALQSYWAAHPGEIQVTGVFTQPDKPAGRRRKLTPCPVKQAALDMGLEVLTPLKSGGPDALEALARWRPDFVVVCAYGKLLPRRVLDVPPLGCFNLHFSLLPRWRGASPIQAAILAGDTATGVSLQRMVMQLDAGPVALEAPAAILPDDTAGVLGQRLADLSGELLTRALPDLLQGRLSHKPQDESAVTLCHTIRKEDGA